MKEQIIQCLLILNNNFLASGKHIKKGEKICLDQMLFFMKKMLKNMN